MPLDGISAYFLAAELDRNWAETRVDRIRQPGRYDLVLSLRGRGRSGQLLLSANPSAPRLYPLEEKLQVPPEAPMFCMLLRKHLQGAKLLAVRAAAYERVFELRFRSTNELGDSSERRLIFECMGRHSNLILLNAEGLIIDAITHVDHRINRYRELLPARPYVAPPSQNKPLAAELLRALAAGAAPREALWKPLEGGKALGKAMLACFAGFSPPMIEHLLAVSDLDPRRGADSLNEDEWRRLNEATIRLLQRIVAGDVKPTLFFRAPGDKQPSDFHAFDLALGTALPYPSLSALLAAYYRRREAANRFAQQREQLLKRLRNDYERALRLAEVHRAEVAESRDFAARKEEGDLILANLHRLEAGAEELVAEDYYHGNAARRIPLNPHRSPSWNAQSRFALYNKLKRKHESASRRLVADEALCAYLQSLIESVEQAENAGDLSMIREELEQQGLLGRAEGEGGGTPRGFHQRKARRKSRGGAGTSAGAGAEVTQTLGPRRYVSSDGLEIRVGRNNLQNDKLSLKEARKQDLWFHAQKQAGSHVVLKCAELKGEVPARSIEEAAMLAAWFSRASKAGGERAAKTAVDFCPAAELKKPRGAKPGFVVYERYRTVYVTARVPEGLLPSDPAPPDDAS